MRSVSDKSCRVDENILNSVTFSESHIVYEVMWKSTIEPDRLQILINTAHAHCMPDN